MAHRWRRAVSAEASDGPGNPQVAGSLDRAPGGWNAHRRG